MKRMLVAAFVALLAWLASSYGGFMFLLLFDPHYHDGVAALGGVVIGFIAAAVIFRRVWSRMSN